jgi:tRNA(Ile)-lysidine synthase
MHLFADWAKREAIGPPVVLIVDHCLRPESRKDAALAAQWAGVLSLNAHVLRWRGAKPGSNIEDRARTARYRLLGEWCAAHGVANLFVAHTREDQAETFLLRLGRGSGVDGLSAMRASAPLPVAGIDGVRVLRPLLEIGRAELRAFLVARGGHWLEDPMNADGRFARARIRKMLPELEQAGITAARIAEAARHLARAREALEAVTEYFLSRHAHIESDSALLDAAALTLANREIGLRALSGLLMRIGKTAYRPRFERLEALYDAILSGASAARTLSGCRIGKAPKAQAAFGPATLLISREGARKSTGKAGKDEESTVELGKIARVPPADCVIDLS